MDLILWHKSFFLTTIANANLLANLVPFIIIPVNVLIFKAKINKQFLLALLITILGISLLMSGKTEFKRDNLYGDLLAFLTAIFYASYLLVIMRFRKKYQASVIMLYSTLGCCLFLAGFMLITSTSFAFNSSKTLYILIALAFSSQILGQGGMAISLGKLSPLFSSTLILLQPVIASFYAYILFKESLNNTEIIAVTIIILGIWMAKNSERKILQ